MILDPLAKYVLLQSLIKRSIQQCSAIKNTFATFDSVSKRSRMQFVTILKYSLLIYSSHKIFNSASINSNLSASFTNEPFV